MPNNLARAEFWRDFILAHCQYPAQDRLRAQFVGATFTDFCPCGCNGFRVTHAADALPEPLATPGQGGMVFEADFNLPDGKTLEILLFVGKNGTLTGVDVDCLANTAPVPDTIENFDGPFHVYASEALLPSASQMGETVTERQD